MEHNVIADGGYATAFSQMILCASLMIAALVRRYDLLGRFVKFTLTYFYSFSPVAMLIYSLYVVHNLK